MDRYICYMGKDSDEDCDTACKDCDSYGIDRRLGDRRERCLSFKLWERREGFDRRQNRKANKGLYNRIFRHGALHLRNNYTALIILLIIFNLFNVADYMFTLKALAAGYSESNPVMDKLFSMGSTPAGIFKITIGLLVTSIIWFLKRYRLVLEASILILLMYMLLISYHIYGAIRYY